MKRKNNPTLSFRTAVMLLVMLLTSATAWALKTEAPVVYTVTGGSKSIIISGGGETNSWIANTGLSNWKAGVSHELANGMTINTDVAVTVNQHQSSTMASTTFTFTAPDNILITDVKFKQGNSNLPISSHSEPGTTYTVTLAANTYFNGFEVTYGYISGKCGTNATWSLAKQNGQYTALTIGGSGDMNNYGHTTVDDLWRTDAPWGYDLTSVTIGNNITSIGDYAFIGCQQLSSLTIGTGVQTIGTNTFDHCDALTEVTLPASVSTLNAGAFKNCVGLTRLNIQNSDALVTLGSSGLNGTALQYIVVPTPALAVQYKTATNWSASAGKLRVAFGDYLFTATDEGGTAAYAITNETDLRNLSDAVMAWNNASGDTFRQTANITLGNTGFIPIGNICKALNKCFRGTYDGGDYTISGLQISKSDDYGNYGLFGRVENGTVKNVRLVSPSVNVGNVNSQYLYCALVGDAVSSTVKNCVVITPTIEGIGGQKGAIIGFFDKNSYLHNLYFYGGNCNIAVGGGLSQISNVCRARKVTLGSGIGSVSPDANSMDNGFVYNNERYYREKLTLTLTTNLSEKSGYHPVYKVNGKILDGNTYTVNSTDGDVTLTAECTPDIHYIDADGNRQTRSDYTVLTNATNISNLSAGWYVVESNVSYSSDFYCKSGDIHLILCDNAKMTIEPTQGEAMEMADGSLTVYAQSTGNSMGQLEATSSDRTAISSSLNNITICGGKITVTGSTSDKYSGIYANGHFTIHGGQVSATGDYGIRAYSGNVILGLRNANDYITANRYNSTRGSIRIADGQTLTDGTAIYSGTLTRAQIDAIAGKTLRRCFNIVTLADNASNSSAISTNNGKSSTVILNGRTLTKDGTWNTLCLPFSLSAEQIEGSPLAGAVIKEMDSSTRLSNDGLLTLNFKKAESIEAGKAYIVKWETKGENIVNPLFHGVTISNSSLVETESTDGKVKFVGQYSPFAIDNDNINEILFIGSGNKIGYSKNPRSLKSCRAHFWVQPNGFSAGARVINLDLGDGMTTSINLVEADDEDASANGIYSLDGRRVKGEPTQKGVYIINGKKVIK